jgi:hypothetical protein
MATKIRYSPNSDINNVILWLLEHKYSPLPVAPLQDPYLYSTVLFRKYDKYGRNIRWAQCPLTKKTIPIRRFRGKNPSYLDESGNPFLVFYKRYLKNLPSDSELMKWFANPLNGLGTLGGQNNTIWLDIDIKFFKDRKKCAAIVEDFLISHPVLQKTFIERTQSGGWRIGIKTKHRPRFKAFSFGDNNRQVGSVLGAGCFTVLAPTIGRTGNPYTSINRVLPVEINSLETVDIYPVQRATGR